MELETKRQIDDIMYVLTFKTDRVPGHPHMFDSTCVELNITVCGGSFEGALSGCTEAVMEKLKSPSFRNVAMSALNQRPVG